MYPRDPSRHVLYLRIERLTAVVPLSFAGLKTDSKRDEAIPTLLFRNLHLIAYWCSFQRFGREYDAKRQSN